MMRMEGQKAPRPRLVRVAKEFEFHAAHVLPNHDGQCARLHGHTYRLRVVVIGVPVEPHPAGLDPSEGMVCDFSVLKDIYRRRIEPLVEHQQLHETLAGLVEVTTCEQMAVWLFDTFATECWQRDLTLDSVTLWETPTSYAEVRASD